MSFLVKSKEWIEKLKTLLYNDVPLIVFVTLILSLTAAIYPEGSNTFHFAKVIFLIAFLKAFWLGVVASLLSFNKTWLKWLFLSLNIIIFEIYFYLILQFNVRLNSFVFSLILQTTPQEASEFFISFFPLNTVLALMLSALILFMSYYMFNKIWTKKFIYNKRLYFMPIILCLFIFSILTYSLFRHSSYTEAIDKQEKWLLIQLFEDTRMSYVEITTSIQTIIQKGNFEHTRKICQANEMVKIDSCHFISPNIVFIIGESYIKNHSSLYGYQHETSPYMNDEKQKGNLFVFTDVITHIGGTAQSMQFFYSTKSVDDGKVWEEQPLFPAIFKKAGYHVSLFDNQSTRNAGSEMWDYSTSYFINPSITHNQCFNYRNAHVYPYDLEMVKGEMKLVKGNKLKNTLTIFHLYGQHVNAKIRYPNMETYNYFTADSIRREELDYEQREKIAHYDNATRYNDIVINEIFNLYRNKDAVVIYVSDHGDCMYDDAALTYGRVISGQHTDDAIKVLYEVPMVIWCSDKYKENHPEIVERIRKSVNRPFMHDDICHVLFDLAGIYTSHYNPSRSVINDKFKARQRFVNDGQYNYDINKSRLDKVQLRTKDN